MKPGIKDRSWLDSGKLRRFPMEEFLSNGFTMETSEYRDYGFIYWPNSCEQKRCDLVFVLHGCGGQSEGLIWGPNGPGLGATNDMIMVYPDSRCWDLVGKIDPKWGTQDGLYPKAFMAMIN